MRLRTLLFLLLIPTLTGSAVGQEQEGTELTIRAVNERVGRAEFHLSCDPPGGDLPNPARACAALSKEPDLVTRPESTECRAQYCAWGVRIEGSLTGKPIDNHFSLDPTSPTLRRLGMSWEVLQRHVLPRPRPRQREEILPETRRVFEPGELEYADLITCDIRGHHLKASVPSHSGSPRTVGYSGANIIGVKMTVRTREDGSVVADCHTNN